MPSESGGNKRPWNTSAGTHLDGTAVKRIKPLSGRSGPQDGRAANRDDKFWYTDGNIVVRVEDSVFKLHRSRLQHNCVYFKNLIRSGVRVNEHIERFPVYNAPEGVTPQGFKLLLTAIEMPLENIKAQLTHPMTVSLLEVAYLLSCDTVLRLAKNRLCALWDSRPVPAQLDPGDIRPYTTTIATIHLAREHKVSYILKRAFYELLSNEEYWNVYHKDCNSINLSSRDRERVLCARDVLSKLWREFALTAPDATPTANAVNMRRAVCPWCCYGNTDRGPSWRLFIVEKGDQESGALDPLRYDLVKLRREELLNEWWCEGCLLNKENAWRAKRVEWWRLLDDLLKL